MAEQIRIQVRFSVETSHGQYNDALYFTQVEYDALQPGELDTLKQKRVDDWEYALDNPPEYIEPSLAILQQMRRENEDEIARIMIKLEPLASKKDLEDIRIEYEAKIEDLNASISNKELNP